MILLTGPCWIWGGLGRPWAKALTADQKRVKAELMCPPGLSQRLAARLTGSSLPVGYYKYKRGRVLLHTYQGTSLI